MTQRPDYLLVDTPAGFERAARELASGRGPFAVDTERASAFRYDDRAFLVQIHRRGAGTYLIAPEGHRDTVREILGPVVNGGDWIIHAAGEDLASLALLGLHPRSLFDTELAARLAGFDRPNLGAMVEHFTGVVLEKGHGRENWSETPLPEAWLEYAALDVDYLLDLADGLTETLDVSGLLECAEQEFSHLVEVKSLRPPVPRTWRGMKGLSTVRSQAGLQVARSLWLAREQEAKERDVSPSKILPDKIIVDIARTRPSTPAELAAVHGFPARRKGAADRWIGQLRQSLDASKSSWPEPKPRLDGEAPSKSSWERNYPESWAALQRSRELIAAAALDLGQSGIPAENLLAPAVLRQAVWDLAGAFADTHLVHEALTAAGARPWQAEITAPLVSRALRG